MQIYRGWLELLDYVFFATTERGKVYETGAFIHNYALAYAMHLASAPYYHRIQEPNYEGELSELNTRGIYLTPASPERAAHRLMQWNTIAETYGFGKKPRSIGYPDWGFARVLRPESLFRFYILVTDPNSVPSTELEIGLQGQHFHVRLGKFPAKARVRLERAISVEEKHSEFTANGRSGSIATSVYLNWRDLEIDPFVCDVLPATLPTRLIANAHFLEGDHYFAVFEKGDHVILPKAMRFLARPLEMKGKR